MAQPRALRMAIPTHGAPALTDRTRTPARRWARLVVCLGLLTLGLASCGAQATVLPPAPPTIHVVMDEHRIEVVEGRVPQGRVVFSVANRGDVEHRVALIPLPPDFPPIHEQVRSSERRVVRELAAIPNTPPGQEATFAVDLPPGRYGLACFVVDDGQTHAEKGEVTEFRVR